MSKRLSISERTRGSFIAEASRQGAVNPRPPMQPTPINALDHVESCVIYGSLLTRSQPEALTPRIALDL